jgi:myo-inositol 2-dehydrogenase/D-chiro-inositol 1-dehydrogenase
MLTFCQFGAGRIGLIHAANIAAHPGAELRYVVDVNQPAAEALAAKYGAKVTTADAALADPAVKAVLIASSTDTHADLIERAAKAGKAILCEKPVDLSLARVDACLKVADKAGVPLLIGFNRRFDPSFSTLRQELKDGAIGKLELLTITSRDPGPPPMAYIKVSGGLFRDMMIHDFDLARWLLGEEPIEVYATASCLVDPAIGQAGDIDTAAVVLRTKSGTIAQISNSRRAVYGYDQRIEAFGAGGMLRAENRTPTTVERSTGVAVSRDKPLHFFLERYAEAYRAELDHFVTAVSKGEKLSVGGADGRAALALAEAALESSKTGKPVKPA